MSALEDTVMEDRRELVGRNIVRARREAGLNQETLALRTRILRTNLSKYECGHHEPSHRTLLRIAEALGKPFGWFYLEHDDPPNEEDA